ncbi:MAG: nucleoside monophosphate kinase [Verrucomicrobiota bacterium]
MILLGPPGSGKGTVAVHLQKELGLPHVSSGHLLRREVENGSTMGRRAKLFIDKGELVPNDAVLELVNSWLLSSDAEEGFVLDGFPRNLAQAKVLDEWLRQTPIEKVILFDSPESVIVDRITGRRTCPKCGRVYQLPTLAPSKDGVCDDCGTMVVQREDDQEPVVRKRYDIYRRETEPLAAYYRQQGKLTVVDATRPLEQRLSAATAALRG